MILAAFDYEATPLQVMYINILQRNLDLNFLTFARETSCPF